MILSQVVRLAAVAATALVAVPRVALTQARPAAPITGAHVSPGLQAELLAAREAIWRAWFANDTTSLNRLLPEVIVAVPNGDSLWEDREAVMRTADEFEAAGGRLVNLEFPRTEFQVFGDVAVLFSTFRMELEDKNGRSRQTGRATEVFVKRNGVWQNPGWHLDSGR